MVVGAALSAQVLGLPPTTHHDTTLHKGHFQNWVAIQDARGVMYFGNTWGVMTFDGSRWSLIPVPNGTIPRALAMGPDGVIYFGASGDLGFLAADSTGKLSAQSLLDKVPKEKRGFNNIWQAVSTPQGVYMFSRTGILRILRGEVHVVEGRLGSGQACVMNGTVFYPDIEKGLCALQGDKPVALPVPERFLNRKRMCLAIYDDHQLLLGRVQGPFLRYDVSSSWDPQARRYDFTRPIPESACTVFPCELETWCQEENNLLYKLVPLPDGNFMLCSLRGGAAILDHQGRVLDRLSTSAGLMDNTVGDAFVDQAGNLWIMTNTFISHLEYTSPQRILGVKNGVDSAVISLGWHGQEMYLGSFQNLKRLRPFDPRRDTHPVFMEVKDSPGEIWDFRRVGTDALVATSRGMARVQGDRAFNLRTQVASAICLGQSLRFPNHVFLGQMDGLALFQRDPREDIGWKLVSDFKSNKDTKINFRQLIGDARGDLWATTESKGIFRVRVGASPEDIAIESFGKADGLPGLENMNLFINQDRLYVTTPKGIYTANPHESKPRFQPETTFGKAYLEPPSPVRYLHFLKHGAVLINAEKGVTLATPVQGGFKLDAKPFLGAKIPDEIIVPDPVRGFWLPTKVLTHVDPSKAKNYDLPFHALIRKVLACSKHLVFDGNHSADEGGRVLTSVQREITSLPYAQNELQFDYAATFYEKPGTTEFQYKLVGFDKAWSDWSLSSHKEYTNLPEGKYNFSVKARNIFGTVGKEANYVFVILPPWYRTWWAYLLDTVLFSCMGYAVLRWRSWKLEQEKRVLEQRVQERTEHLEKLNAIVKSINEKFTLDALLDAILKETRVIHGAEKASALVRTGEVFRFRACRGWNLADLEGYELTLQEAEARYSVDALEIHRDIYVIQEFAGRAGTEVFGDRNVPKAMLVMRIRVEDRVEGYFIFDNLQDANAFDRHDIELLTSLKEHFVSALMKANAVEALNLAREEERAAKEKEKTAREMEMHAREAAERATRSKSEFLANMSHEIRTPMNAILGFSDLGLRLEASPKLRDYLRKISRAGKSLLGIINDILDFSKIEAGKLHMEAIPFRVTDLLSDVTDLFAQTCGEKGLELVLDHGHEVPEYLVGDPMRLSQVLINLVSNAVKFTSQGFVLIKVEGGARVPGGVEVRFSVRDSGIGLAPEQQQRLFQPFSQADSSTTRKFGGTGLGLTISRRLVEMMGGHITLESELGKGTTFAFTLPMCIPERGSQALEVPLDIRNLRILVVDDQPVAREVLRTQLQAMGFHVSCVGSGTEALEVIQTHPVDLVITDWKMPGMDGVELAQRIKSDARTARIPTTIMVSAHGREDVMLNAQRAGVEGFLIKPVNASLLLETILGSLGRESLKPRLEDPPELPMAPGLKGIRILLAEDNAINQEIALELLTGAGLQVDLATTGLEAVRMVDLVHYDAVLMDVQMPELDGYSATARIREKTLHQELPIIAMTAHAMAEYREECLAAGMNDFIAKPIEPSRLFATLEKWVKGHPTTTPEPVPLQESSPAPGPFDIRAGIRRLAGHEDRYYKLLGDFARQEKDTWDGVCRAVESGDWSQVEQRVHSLKGVAGNLAAMPLFTAASNVERQLRQGQALEASVLEAFGQALEEALVAAASLASLPTEDFQATGSHLPLIENPQALAHLKETHQRLSRRDPTATTHLSKLIKLLPPDQSMGLLAVERALDAYDFKGAIRMLEAWIKVQGLDEL